MIVGGRRENVQWRAINDVKIYNIETDTFDNSKPQLPWPRYESTLVVKNEYMYIFGGKSENHGAQKTVARIKLDFQSNWDTNLPLMKTSGHKFPVLPYN